jgi:hypothetical protein
MSRFRVIIVFLYISLAAKLVYAVDERRVIPIVVSTVATNDYRIGQPLLVEVDVFNGLDSEIGFLTFSLTPNAWNGEVFSVHVIDVYREGKLPSILISGPELHTPPSISGARGERVPAKGRKRIQIDLSKWEISGGWKAGRYQFTVALANIDVDSFTTLRVTSHPAEITVR